MFLKRTNYEFKSDCDVFKLPQVTKYKKRTNKTITCCRQSWDSAEMHPHLLPLHCDKNIEIKMVLT